MPPLTRLRSVHVLLPQLCLLALAAMALASMTGNARAQDEAPTTEFEDNGGSAWTSEEGEQTFLSAVTEQSPRAELIEIGRTLEGRPIQLVVLGEPAPASVEQALDRPTMYFTCSVHGNEPAGREACLISLRDLAFSTDEAVTELLSDATVLFTPAANPDGRAANSRGNSTGADINRDHLNLRHAESQAIGSVIGEWQPDVVLDMHEYGPGQPVTYDDDILVLWPRNVNVDEEVYSLGVSLVNDHLMPGVEERGYSADEYGLQSVGDDVDVTQTAGDGDEGILRNLGGLRHSVGILVESAVSPRLINPVDPTDVADEAMPRRVASQVATIEVALEFLGEQGEQAMTATAASRERKAEEGAERSAPVYFDGQRQDSTIDGSGPPPSEEGTVDPPPCGYRLTGAQFEHVEQTLDLLGVESAPADDDAVEVPMGQEAEPLIPLLLDARGTRNHFTGTDATWEGDEDDVPAVLQECAEIDGGARLLRRIAGPTRPATAAAVAEVVVVESDTIVIATTNDYADALSGTVLAQVLDAPLLLSDPDRLSSPVADEVTRRGVTDAVLLGGEAALSAQVQTDLEELGVEVRRLAGANRFETAGAVFDDITGPGEMSPDDVLVVEGEHADPARGWPDAISAATLNSPILLVNAERLPEATASRLADADVRIVGGPAAVGDDVEAEIASHASTVDRLFGQNRYETSLAALESRSFGGSGEPPAMWLASGRDWPEALVGAARAFHFLLIDGQDPEGSPATTQYLTDQQDELFGTVNLVGADEHISVEVEQSLRDALNAPEGS